MILIGIDPHKSFHTAVAVDPAGHEVAQRPFVVNAGIFRQLLRWCEQWPEHRFAIEGARGLGRTLAQQLAAAGEDVVDVPSTLSARARLRATGGDRKTDATGALHVAQVALFRGDLRIVVPEDQATIPRLLTERHDDLVHERTCSCCAGKHQMATLITWLSACGSGKLMTTRAGAGCGSSVEALARW